MNENMPSKRIDISLDPKIIEQLDKMVAEYGSNMNRSAMIAMSIKERYDRSHKVK